MVKLRPHRQVTAIDFSHLKLAKCFYGPFQILSKIGQIAYKLHLPEGSCIHSIFHCSTLKPYHQPSSSSDSPIALPTRTLTTNPSFHHLCSWACGGNRSRANDRPTTEIVKANSRSPKRRTTIPTHLKDYV